MTAACDAGQFPPHLTGPGWSKTVVCSGLLRCWVMRRQSRPWRRVAEVPRDGQQLMLWDVSMRWVSLNVAECRWNPEAEQAQISKRTWQISVKYLGIRWILLAECHSNYSLGRLQHHGSLMLAALLSFWSILAQRRQLRTDSKASAPKEEWQPQFLQSLRRV